MRNIHDLQYLISLLLSLAWWLSSSKLPDSWQNWSDCVRLELNFMRRLSAEAKCRHSCMLERGAKLNDGESCTVTVSEYTQTRLTALCPGLPGWAGTRKVKPIWILLKQETVNGNGRMPFLPPSQQHQSTEGTKVMTVSKYLCWNTTTATTTLV